MKLMEGKIVSNTIREKIKKEVAELKGTPYMVDIQIGNNAASDIYIASKEKAASEVDMKFECIRFDSNVQEDEVISKIEELNNNNNVHGIFIQSPIPNHLDEVKLQNYINPLKDVDGLTYVNAGKLLNNKSSLVSCTPAGVLEILKYYNIKIEGSNAVIIGRSNLVGKPLFNLLTNNNATVTLCHSKSENISNYTKNADIIIVAVGISKFLKTDMVKENAVVIDVGINRIEGKVTGDVDFEEVSTKSSYITPVPGGVGPMTVTMLLSNLLKAYKMQEK